jgi:hypothetical protein
MAFVAALALSAIASATASAATAGWMVGGSQLVGSEALATTAAVDKTAKLSGGGVEIECTGKTLNGVSPQIVAGNMGEATSLTFTGCVALTKNCTLSSTSISTLPVLAEATLEGAANVAAKFTPKTGTVFATFKFEGENCGVAGTKAVTGSAITTTPNGQTESAAQILEVNTAASESTLKLGSAAAKLSGAALLKLVSGKAWSFL